MIVNSWLRICFLIVCFIGNNILSAQKFLETPVSAFSKMQGNYGNAVADYDLDGDLDVFIVANQSFSTSNQETWSRLLNNKGGRFDDVTVEAGFKNQHALGGENDLKLGVSWGDYDNDGYPDLLLAHQNGTELYRNRGDGTFVDVTSDTKITSCTLCNNTSGLWWDYDKDGDLDLYLNYLDIPNRLYENLGDGSFQEIEGALNLNDPARTWSSLPLDVNNDGWVDIYVVNDFGLSKVYINQDGKSFLEATSTYNLENKGCGMGSTIGDYNNDGNFDIYVTNIAEFKSNPLFSGNEDGVFENQEGIQGVGNGHFGWGTKFIDADNDGDQDLYVVNGHFDLNYNNVFFKNLREEGEGEFRDWSIESQTNGGANGMGTEVFDFDNDGDLDILVSNTNHSPYLYKNQTANPNAWIQIDLEGVESNRNAFGSKLIASAGGKHKFRLHFGSNMLGQSIKPVHFGLGEVDKIDSLTVFWPNGKKEKIYDIAINQKVKIIENKGLTEGEWFVEFGEDSNGDSSEGDKETSVLLKSPYPNPFSDYTEFEITIEEASVLVFKVYTLSGVEVCNSSYTFNEPQEWKLRWNTKTLGGKSLPAGVYLYNIQVGEISKTGKMIIR